MTKNILSRENLVALALVLIILLVIIMTVDQAPQWIYAGY